MFRAVAADEVGCVVLAVEVLTLPSSLLVSVSKVPKIDEARGMIANFIKRAFGGLLVRRGSSSALGPRSCNSSLPAA